MTTTPCTNPFCHDGQCTVEHAGSSATVDCARCAGTGVIAAHPQPVAVSGEWVMVPREPTLSMDKAGEIAACRAGPMEDWPTVVYKAMLAAAPQAEPAQAEYPECSGDPRDCPENEGHGCCKPAQAAEGGTPSINVRADWQSEGLGGTRYLAVNRVEQEDDGSFTAVVEGDPEPPEPESAAPAVSDGVAQIRHVGRGLLVLFRGDTEVRDVGPTPGIGQRDRDEIIARYNAFPALTEQVASLVAEVGQARQTAEYWKAEQYKANAENATLRNGITSNGCEIVEAADCDAGGPWVRNVRAEAAEQQLAAMKVERDAVRENRDTWYIRYTALREAHGHTEAKLAASEAALREAREDAELLGRIGGQMSNILYNVAQPTYTVQMPDRARMDQLRREWDAARAATKEPT